MTDEERKLLREKIKSNAVLRYLIESRLRNRQSCVVRVERSGNHRVVLSITQEDLDIALAQLTLLGEL